MIRHVMGVVLWSILVALGATSLSKAEELRFSTLNIRWYGLGGTKEGGPADERRDASLRRFIRRELGESDVLAFEEIVDVDRLQREVLGRDYRCVSYEHADAKHQHVVLCARGGLSFVKDDGGAEYALWDVALGKYRPAVDAVLKDADGHPVAHVVAVHLKAAPPFSGTRATQARIIARHVAGFRDRLPVVVLGDFNTYATEKENDEERIAAIFARTPVPLEQVPNRARYTFRTTRLAGKFDHVWASRGVRVKGRLHVAGPCNDDGADLERYYRFVSDHCPVSVTLDF